MATLIKKIKEEEGLTWSETLAVKIIRTGIIPQHVAFIMDGNRRYARQRGVEVIKGHQSGYKTVLRFAHWCKLFGINEVTFYAFSLENFNRDEQERDELLEYMTDVFEKILEDLELDDQCYRFFGHLDLLPKKFTQLVTKIEMASKNFTGTRVNIALAYGAREDISTSVSTIVKGVRDGYLEEDDIDEYLVKKCLFTRNYSHPDILIRTSGEVRLSNFLLYQVSSVPLVFVKSLWPSLSLWKVAFMILYYQLCFSAVKDTVEKIGESELSHFYNNNDRVLNFLADCDKKNFSILRKRSEYA